MSMEKNGAINSNTPKSGCCGGNCHTDKTAQYRQPLLFPETDEEADAMAEDLTKQAIDEVAKRSRQ